MLSFGLFAFFLVSLKLLPFFFFFLWCSCGSCHAFPSGPGGCSTGFPSPAASFPTHQEHVSFADHPDFVLRITPLAAPLQDDEEEHASAPGDDEEAINNDSINRNIIPKRLQPQVAYELVLESTTETASFRGFLLRFGLPQLVDNDEGNSSENDTVVGAAVLVESTWGAFTIPDDQLDRIQFTDYVCYDPVRTPVASVGHNRAVPKQQIRVVLTVPAPDDDVASPQSRFFFPLDVNVVVDPLQPTLYTQFRLNAGDAVQEEEEKLSMLPSVTPTTEDPTVITTMTNDDENSEEFGGLCFSGDTMVQILLLDEDEQQEPPNNNFSQTSYNAAASSSSFPKKRTRSAIRTKSIPMKELRVGDWVQVSPHRFEPVYSFGHWAAETWYGDFVVINHHLVLSPQHLVAHAVTKRGFVPASEIRVGDVLLKAQIMLDHAEDEGAPATTTTTVVHSVVRNRRAKGLFAPFTPSGTLLVNDILVSSFVSFNGSSNLQLPLSFLLGADRLQLSLSWHWLSWMFEGPHRWYCRHDDADDVEASDGGKQNDNNNLQSKNRCKSESYESTTGLNVYWTATPYRILQLVLRQPTLVQWGILVPILILLGLGNALLWTMDYGMTSLLLLLVAFFLLPVLLLLYQFKRNKTMSSCK